VNTTIGIVALIAITLLVIFWASTRR